MIISYSLFVFSLRSGLSKSRYIILDNHLVENLQETACGGSVISTVVRGLRISHNNFGRKVDEEICFN